MVNRIKNIIFNIPRFLIIYSYRLFLRIRIFNPKKIPDDKSVIFAFNHTTGADPIIVLGALRKKIHFIASSDNFKSRLTDYFMRKFGNSIPIFKDQLSKNVKSFKELFTISKKGKVFFGIFPEGGLNKSGNFIKFYGGTAYLSLKTKLPIIPVYIHNINKGPNEKSWFGRNNVAEGILSLVMNTFKRINLFIGEPIDPMAENILEDFKELTDKKAYKKVIERINKELLEEFTELKSEADNLFASNKNKDKVKTAVTKEIVDIKHKRFADNDSIYDTEEDEEDEVFGESFNIPY
jgi:1-acyl-sn-glycerol-3-phosphate acyltransferase